jgi:hypothetical protein
MSDQAGKLPVRRAVEAGWSFFLRRGNSLVPAAVIYGIGQVVGGLGQYDITMAMQTETAVPTHAWGLLLLSTVVSCIAMAAMLRVAVADALSTTGNPGPEARVSVGGDELRLVAVQALMLAFFVLVALMSMLPAMALLVPAMPGLNTPGYEPTAGESLILTVLVGLAGAVLFWLLGRLALAPVATIALRQVSVFRTWRWTRGNGGRLVMCLLAVFVPPMILTLVAGELIYGIADVRPATGTIATPVPMDVLLASLGVGGGIAGAAQIVWSGTLAFLLRGLMPTESAAPLRLVSE